MKVFLWSWILWPTISLAGEISVSAEVDQTTVGLGESLYYTVIVEGGDVDVPNLTDNDKFESRYLGPSRSVSIYNGVTKSTTSFRFLMTPLKVGQWSIPPTVVDSGGQRFKTLPITIRVLANGQEGPNGQAAPVFVKRNFNSQKVFVGQPIVSKIKLYHRVPVSQPQIKPNTPSTFKQYPVPGQKDYEERVGNDRYRVTEIAEILVPLKVGKINVTPYEMLASTPSSRQKQRRRRNFDMFDDMFNGAFSGRQMVRKSYRSEAIALDVMPLPKGADSKFSGLLGDFNLSTKLSHTSISAGDTVTLTINLEGYGNLSGASPFENLSLEGFKIYPDKPKFEVRASLEGLLSKGQFKFALVPNKSGKIELGEIRIQVFNHKTSSYEWLTDNLGVLNVTGDLKKRGEAGISRKRQVEQLNADMITIHSGSSLHEVHELTWRSVAFAASACSIPLFIGLFGWGRQRMNRDPSQRIMRLRDQAWKTFIKNSKGESNLSDFHNQLRQYFGDRFALSSESITWGDVENVFAKYKLDNHSSLKKVFQFRDQMEFGELKIEEADFITLKENCVNEIEKLEMSV